MKNGCCCKTTCPSSKKTVTVKRYAKSRGSIVTELRGRLHTMQSLLPTDGVHERSQLATMSFNDIKEMIEGVWDASNKVLDLVAMIEATKNSK